MDSKNQLADLRNQLPDMPTFEEDEFDLMEYKNATTAKTLAKAKVKRDRRKVSVGRIIVMFVAFAVCALLYLLASRIGGIFF